MFNLLSNYSSYVFLPILICFIFLFVGGAALFIVLKKKPEKFKTALIVVGVANIVALTVAIILIALYFSKDIAGTDDGINSAMLYISAAALIVVSTFVAIVADVKNELVFDTHCIAFAGISVALSFTLSYIKLWVMPQGGVITLASMLPVALFAFIYGAKRGMLVGLTLGVLTAITDPYIIHPAQFLLDYPIAFSFIGFAGILNGVSSLDKIPQIKFTLSTIIAATLRCFTHVLSGVFAFASYAGEENVLIYSIAYNSFVFVDIAIVIVIGFILLSSKLFRKEIEKLQPPTNNN